MMKQNMHSGKRHTTLRKLQDRILNAVGFTLLEIFVVIFILGALMAMAIPRYLNVIERQKAQEGERMLLAVLSSQKRYQLDNNVYAPDLASLDITLTGFVTDYFKNPTTDSNANDANGLAQIQRKDLTYTLLINASGQISCTPSGSGSTCSSLGY